MRWLAVLALGGCGFSHGLLVADARGDDTDAPARDAPADAPSTCYEQWLSGTIAFEAAVALTSVNSTGYDRDPFLTDNELTLYLSSPRTGTSGQTDVWVATRTTIADPFSTPIEASAFNSTAVESKLSISASGTIAVVGSNRPGSANIDVWESIRATTADPWPAMNRTNVAMVDTGGNEHDPTLSADGQHLYLAPDDPSPQHLVVATRGTDGRFGTPVPLLELSGGGDADPSPTPDERILVFASSRSGAGDLWYATRVSAAAELGAPLAVPGVNTAAPEGDPHLSSDGCRLYFARNLGGDNWDLYVASAVR